MLRKPLEILDLLVTAKLTRISFRLCSLLLATNIGWVSVAHDVGTLSATFCKVRTLTVE